MQSKKQIARVVGTFVALIVLFNILLDWGPVTERFHVGRYLAQLSAWLSYGILQAISAVVGFPLHRNGTIMGSGAFEVDVAPACSGAVPMSIYLAAVLAYPTSWRSKSLGSVLGLTAILVVNLFRVSALFLIGLYFQEIFHETHVYVAQALVVCVAVALWMYWAAHFADAPAH